ncbi:MAG: putative Fe-S cluster assembly protein SufT [Gammaproteobacteria bacterium]|nr:putative Fe-S cluster assembly protein SufT [Gammaproteobacteria bacterium]MDE0367140.1 putative Fe-S cluster assembly protein SufT [Gammaproteobacteria bacterium]
MERQVVPIGRTVDARLVPTGDPVTIPNGTFVTLTQSLGGTYTVVFNGNMARIDGADADALGLTPEVLEFEAPANGQVDPDQVERALASVFDPEIPVSILDLGLIYDRRIGSDGTVSVVMTLTAPGCGMGPVLVDDVKSRLAGVPNVRNVEVELVFDPPWSREMMSEEARLELGLF